jgi:DNA-binding transcriptional regulator LsrR (DeoR family)
MAFIAPFRFPPPIGERSVRDRHRGADSRSAFEACGPMQKNRGLGTAKIAKALGIDRASVYRVLEVGR